MNAVLLKSFGDPSQMYVGSTPKPELKEGYLLIKVKATAINRADTLQRKGKYLPPPGESEIMGLEICGDIEEIGDGCSDNWKIGDRVCGLVGGGGYAEYCLLHSEIAMKIPDEMTYETGAAIPETFMTAYQLLHYVGGMSNEENTTRTILFHAGASGVGVAAINLIKNYDPNIKVIITAGSQEKIDFCKDLGADFGINYKTENFVEKVMDYTDNTGVDLVCCPVGSNYFGKNLESLATEGRYVLFGFLSGAVLPDNSSIGLILRKRLKLEGTTLRSRSIEYKSRLAADVEKEIMNKVVSNEIRVVIDTVFTINEISQAHEYMENNKNKGKIVITVQD